MNFKPVIPPSELNIPHRDSWFFLMTEAWVSDTYMVMSRVKCGIRHIAMCRTDGDKMEYLEKFDIKNELFGDDVKAVEIFPPKNELVDDKNVYHLWVFENGCDELDKIEL